MNKKSSFKNILSAFDNLWENIYSDNLNFIDEWEKILKKSKWTEEEFDNAVNKQSVKKQSVKKQSVKKQSVKKQVNKAA